MNKGEKVNRVLTDLSRTGYTPELVRCEARLLIEELNKENKNYKEVIDKVRTKAIYLQEQYGYILDDLIFLLKEVE